MQDNKKRIHAKKAQCAGLLLTVLLVLCGCTKKEELRLLGEEDFLAKEGTSPAEEVQSGEALPAAAEVNPEGAEVSLSAETELTENPGVIYIHVCGAVMRPGVYELEAGSRVYEAVQAAGGFAEGADQNYVNQAQQLNDGVKLVVPTLEEASEAQAGELLTGTVREDAGADNTESSAVQIGIIENTPLTGSGNEEQAKDSGGRININTASEAQLCDIPGIGATRAAAIIAYREAHGGFQKPEDIMKVNGIKEGMYEKIKDSISVN